MIALSMAYTVLVSVGVCIGAVIVERVFRRGWVSTRYVWLGALCLSSFAAWRSVERTGDESGSSQIPLQASDGLTWQEKIRTSGSAVWTPRRVSVPLTDSSRARKIEAALIGVWITSSLLTFAMFAAAAWRLRGIRLRAEPTNLNGAQVFVTSSVGPLVVGTFHPSIIVPKWVLSLDAAQIELVFAHEAEHVRARDPRLLMLGALAVSVAPWNPMLWFGFRKLRESIETDCDRRVLKVHPDSHAYGELLVSVASRSPVKLAPVTGLSASVSTLEKRLTLMKDNSRRIEPHRILSGIALAAVVVGATAMVPRPVPSTNKGAILSLASQSRATGRVRVSGVAEHGYRVFTSGGVFSVVNKPNVTRKDSKGGLIAAFAATGDIFDVDVTRGPIHFEARDKSSLHIEAAMGGSSSAAWVSGTGPHLILQQGGTGIALGGPGSVAQQDPTTFFEFQVDTPVVDIARVTPAYPAALRTSGPDADVWTQFVVDERGEIEMESFKALKSTGPEFTAAVLAVLPKWQFKPAKRHGKEVRQVVQLAFEFKAPAHR